MRILAVETSTPVGSVAVLEDGGLKVEKQFNVGWSHCRRLMTEIDNALESAGMCLEELNMMAVGIGPGSFTGLRVGLSTLKGFSMGLGIPVVPVSTLEALAHGGRLHRGVVCPCLDAKKSQVYYSLFHSTAGGMDSILEDSVGTPEDVLGELSRLGISEAVLFLGDGAGCYRNIFSDSLGQRATFAEGTVNYPRASSVGILAAGRSSTDSSVSVLEPVYVRKSEAELGRSKREC